MDNPSVPKSMSLEVYTKVKSMIFNRELMQGEHIPEERIAEFVGGSRTPVREALRMLASEGLVKIYPRRYAEVAVYDEKSIQEIATVRLMQDLMSARLAIQFGTNQDFLDMQTLVEECDDCALHGNVEGWIEADNKFHMAITYTGKNKFLIDSQKKIYQIIQLIQISRYTSIEDSLQNVRHHSEILRKLFQRDYPGASNMICDHLQGFYNINTDIASSFRSAV